MSGIQVLKNSRGNPMLYYSGYFYTQYQVTEKKRIFRCEDRNCRSKKKKLGIFFNFFLFLRPMSHEYPNGGIY
jgi:hypothetical protein